MWRRYRSLVLSCAVLWLSGGAALAQQGPWKFLAFGDCVSFDPGEDVSTNILSELADEVVRQHPDFVLFLGDFAISGTPEGLSIWSNTMAPVFQAGIPIYPVIGNHDYLMVPSISNLFSAWIPTNGPEGEKGGTYALEYKNALILVLNEFVGTNMYRVNQPWIDAVLATNTHSHVFAAGHVPAFKLWHQDCLNYYPANRDAFWNSLSNANARIYFSGHDHMYDHTRLDDGEGVPGNDLHQIIAGTASAPLYADSLYDGNNGIWRPSRIFHEQNHGFVSVQVDGLNVTSTWYHRVDTNVYVPTSESFSYSALPRPVLRHSYARGTLTLVWPGQATLQAAPGPDATFTNVPGAISPWVVNDLPDSRVFYRLTSP